MIPKFKNYQEALDFIAGKAKHFPNKNEYYASEEYKKIYPLLENLRTVNASPLAKKGKTAMKEAGIKEGDCVEYSTANPFGEIFVFEGRVKLDKNKIPYVLLNKSVTGKKKIRWHKGFKACKN